MNVEDEIRLLKSHIKGLWVVIWILAAGVGILGVDALIQSFRIDALM